MAIQLFLTHKCAHEEVFVSFKLYTCSHKTLGETISSLNFLIYKESWQIAGIAANKFACRITQIRHRPML